MPLALRCRAQAHPSNGHFAPRHETRRGSLADRADVDIVGGLIVLGLFTWLGFVIGLVGFLVGL